MICKSKIFRPQGWSLWSLAEVGKHCRLVEKGLSQVGGRARREPEGGGGAQGGEKRLIHCGTYIRA